MANPNKFGRQIRHESQLGLNAESKPKISRHATSLAISVKVKGNVLGSPVKRAQSAKPKLQTERSKAQTPQPQPDETEDVDSHVTLSELESCVSALALVQLQLDKQCKWNTYDKSFSTYHLFL